MLRVLRNRQSGRESGFTLIELLAVIIIIGILASIAVPNYLRNIARAHDSTVINFVNNQIVAESQGWVKENPASWTGPYKSDVSPYLTTPANMSWNVIPAADATTNGSVTTYSNRRYCIMAYSTKGYKYTASSPLLFDSLRGGIVTTLSATGARTPSNASGFNSTDTSPNTAQLTVRANDTLLTTGASSKNGNASSTAMVTTPNGTTVLASTPRSKLSVTWVPANFNSLPSAEYYLNVNGALGAITITFLPLAGTAKSAAENASCKTNNSAASANSYYFFDNKNPDGSAASPTETATNVVRVCKGNVTVVVQDASGAYVQAVLTSTVTAAP